MLMPHNCTCTAQDLTFEMAHPQSLISQDLVAEQVTDALHQGILKPSPTETSAGTSEGAATCRGFHGQAAVRRTCRLPKKVRISSTVTPFGRFLTYTLKGGLRGSSAPGGSTARGAGTPRPGGLRPYCVASSSGSFANDSSGTALHSSAAPRQHAAIVCYVRAGETRQSLARPRCSRENGWQRNRLWFLTRQC